jgi:hypothetical protein
MIQCQVIIRKDLPVEQIKQWEDKVVYSIARKTLDFTNSKEHFPYLTGELARASMSEGVVHISKATYGLGAKGVEYAPKVWNYGVGTKWTNKNTIPQWYMGVFEKYKSEIVEDAIKISNEEIK